MRRSEGGEGKEVGEHKKNKKKTASGRKQSISANDVRKMQLDFEHQLENWSKSKRASFSE
ncbi:hypothetical protein [Enterocloster citroniae]